MISLWPGAVKTEFIRYDDHIDLKSKERSVFIDNFLANSLLSGP